MKTYHFEIVEELSKIVTIEATNKEEAFEQIDQQYKSEQLVLTADDFSNNKITLLDPD